MDVVGAIVTLFTILLTYSDGQPTIAASLSKGLSLQNSSGRIVGGEVTSICEHPWQVSVQVLGFHVCGGSVISSSVVLTAGHCTSYRPSWLSVRVASSVLYTGGSVHRVADVIVHQDYRLDSHGIPENDIALFVLKTPAELGYGVRPVALFAQGEASVAGTLANITGWGSTSEGGGSSQELRVTGVPVVGKAQCDESYRQNNGGIRQGQICAGFLEGGKDSCQGDSGGPLVIGGRQAGIVSWGLGCAQKGYPGVYTEVASYRHWIAERVQV